MEFSPITRRCQSGPRVFASATSAPAYSYDPYGNALQGTAPVTDFGYAGMFYNADSGLYLTQYRAYDPVAGRWLSRDPIGESSDPAGNLYPYANGNPVTLTDPDGRFVPLLFLASAAVGAAVGAGVDFAIQLYQNGGNVYCVDPWQVAAAAFSGALLSGLGPEGFLLGRGGIRAAQFGYAEISGLLNSGATRVGWGYNENLGANVLRAVVGGKKYDAPWISLSPYPSIVRSGVAGGVTAGAGWGHFGRVHQ